MNVRGVEVNKAINAWEWVRRHRPQKWFSLRCKRINSSKNFLFDRVEINLLQSFSVRFRDINIEFIQFLNVPSNRWSTDRNSDFVALFRFLDIF